MQHIKNQLNQSNTMQILLLFRVCHGIVHPCCVSMDVCFVLFFLLCVCICMRLPLTESKVHCGGAVRFGRASAGYLHTAHHLYAFLLEAKQTMTKTKRVFGTNNCC